MAKRVYTSFDAEKDRDLIRLVESSDAIRYIDELKDTPDYVLGDKIKALRVKYTKLTIKGGESIPVERCKPSRISEALKKEYNRAKKKIAEYESQLNQPSEDLSKKIAEARKSTTLEQHMAALQGDGYWVQMQKEANSR